jgi:hypothetical protein
MLTLCLGLAHAARTLDLPKFVEGKWDATVHTLTVDGDLEDDPRRIRFQMVPHNSSFVGLVKGYDDNDFNITVSINPNHAQTFRIDGPEGFLAQPEIVYLKRNFPFARGPWKDGLGHFKFLVFDNTKAELSLYLPSESKVLLFRIVKTVVPAMKDALRPLLLPTAIGLLVIVYRMWTIHKYVVERDKTAGEKTEPSQSAEAVKEKQE